MSANTGQENAAISTLGMSAANPVNAAISAKMHTALEAIGHLNDGVNKDLIALVREMVLQDTAIENIKLILKFRGGILFITLEAIGVRSELSSIGIDDIHQFDKACKSIKSLVAYLRAIADGMSINSLLGMWNRDDSKHKIKMLLHEKDGECIVSANIGNDGKFVLVFDLNRGSADGKTESISSRRKDRLWRYRDFVTIRTYDHIVGSSLSIDTCIPMANLVKSFEDFMRDYQD
jgi:hypothetical protein